MKKCMIGVIFAVLLSLILAAPALAGAPDVPGEKRPAGVGGLPPQAPPEGGWTEYPPAPAASGGVIQTYPHWPLGAQVENWLNQNVNPGKWLVDGAVGSLTGMLKTLAGAFQQIVFWLSGREVENPYAGGGQGQGAQGARVSSTFNVISYTDPYLTYTSAPVVGMYQTATGVAAFMLGLAVFLIGGRGLMETLAGREPFRGLGETIRRLIVGIALAVIFSYTICEAVIDLNNLLIQVFSPWEFVDDVLQAIMYNEVTDLITQTGLVLETALMMVVLLFALVILAIIMLSRLVLLDILIIIGPVAGMAYATPETEFLFTRWFNALISVTFYQFLSMLFLGLGFRFMDMAWSRSAENVLLLAFVATMCVIMAIVGPPIVGFAVSRAAAATVQRAGARTLAAVAE